MKQAALAIIRNSDGEFLLQHKDKDAPHHPNTWCLFGGGLEHGEKPEAAIEREIQEELLETIPDAQLVLHTIDGDNQIERFYFAFTWDVPAEKLKSQLQEGDDVAYFSIEQLKNMKVNSSHLDALLHSAQP